MKYSNTYRKMHGKSRQASAGLGWAVLRYLHQATNLQQLGGSQRFRSENQNNLGGLSFRTRVMYEGKRWFRGKEIGNDKSLKQIRIA
jgi:hypothetical protein